MIIELTLNLLVSSQFIVIKANIFINLFLFPDTIMISDIQLALFANFLGVSLFLLVVLYHYIATNPRA